MNALEEFRSLGIDFVILHEGVDTSTPNGRLVLGIFAPIGELNVSSSVTGSSQDWPQQNHGGSISVDLE